VASRRDADLAPFHQDTMERTTTTVAWAIDAFLIDLELAGRSPRTLRPYRSYLKPLLAYDLLYDVDDDALRALLLEHKRKNQRTAYTLHTVLSSFYAWCERQGYGPSPMKRIPRPQQIPPEHRYLSKAEIARVYAACAGDEERLIIRLLLLGLRARELLGLAWGDLDGQELRVVKTKGGRPRRAWLDAETVRLLEMAFTRFPENVKSPIIPCRYEALRERLRRLSRRSGVPFTAHTWRRTWASHAFLEGMNQSSVQRLGGWSGSKMAEFYARSALDAAAVRDAERFDLTRRLLPEAPD